MRLVDLAGEALERADELLDRAAHDVAKYMAMTARNVTPAALEGELAALLLRDLRETTRGQPAWELWAALSRDLRALADAPELAALDEDLGALASLTDRWAGGEADLAEELLERTLGAADRIRALRREVRARLSEERR